MLTLLRGSIAFKKPAGYFHGGTHQHTSVVQVFTGSNFSKQSQKKEPNKSYKVKFNAIELHPRVAEGLDDRHLALELLNLLPHVDDELAGGRNFAELVLQF